METFIAGEWVHGSAEVEVRSPYTNEVVDTVPLATLDDVDRALDAAVEGAKAMAALPAYARSDILERAAAHIMEEAEELARIITAEQGKHRGEAQAEAERIPQILWLCAEEARRIHGEVLPMDAAPVGVGRLAYTRREPTGVVLAITPFNYPAILVVHKIGPALAAGNAVVLKPALTTPLTSLFIVRHLVQAGLPPLGLQCVIGHGSSIGQALCADRRVRKISFTGSYLVGEAIARAGGVKRLTCELGSNAAMVILDDADVERAIGAAGFSGYTNAGQNCVSTQRLLVAEHLRDDVLDGLSACVDRLSPGDPDDPRTDLAPVISADEAQRVVDWIDEARQAGADVLRGGDREGALVQPSLVIDPPLESRVWSDELFGPAIGVRTFASDDEALAVANDTRFGLAASVMTSNLDRALRFAHGLRSGLVNVNPPNGSTWRADFMPWGGFGDSGFGKEGVKYAIADMTEEKLVIVHPGDAS